MISFQNVFFARKYIKIIFFIKYFLYHQNDLKILKKLI